MVIKIRFFSLMCVLLCCANSCNKRLDKAIELNNTGLEFLQNYEIDSAQIYFYRGLQIDSANKSLNRNALSVCCRLGDTCGQERIYNRLITLYPEDYWNYFALGLVRESKGEIKDALRLYGLGLDIVLINYDDFDGYTYSKLLEIAVPDNTYDSVKRNQIINKYYCR